jgi:hypothetical protein
LIAIKIDTVKFGKEMEKLMGYSSGFLEGAEQGKSALLNNLGKSVVEDLKQFIDSNARGNPQALHHVYEWYQEGSPNARLFDISYTVKGRGLSFNSSFSQSSSLQKGSKVPFYNKAEVMENGGTVTIRPRSASVLAFNDNGQDVFTRNPVTVSNPGGDQVQGAYQRSFDIFFSDYFTQSYLQSSGLLDHIRNTKTFKDNLNSGKSGGRSAGRSVGRAWITGRAEVQQ